MTQPELGTRRAGLKDRRLEGQSRHLDHDEPVGVPRGIEVGPAVSHPALGTDLKRPDATVGPAAVEHDRCAGGVSLPGLEDRPQDVGPITPHDDQAIWWFHGPLS
jgi:hypothetical protein